MTVNRVVLPDPDSTTAHRQLLSPTHLDREDREARHHPARVFLGHRFERRDGRPCESVTRRPRWIPFFPEICTYPAANRPVVTGISWCGAAAAWTA